MLPVTILTGFLGSGKTTFINYLLTNNQGEKLAIVENEFGEVSIDSALLKHSQTMELIELSNGCICCSVRGELTEALHELLDKTERGDVAIDRLILETTGLADPGPIIQAFFVDERIRNSVYLDAVITLVDAEHALIQLDEHRVASAQIGFADRIVLTKVDRVDHEQKEAVLNRLNRINQKAEILEAVLGALPKESWLDIKAFEIDNNLDIQQGSYQFESTESQMNFKPFSFDPNARSWNDDIKSYVFRGKRIDIDAIGSVMEQMIENYGNDMLRYKGILAIANNEERLIIQGVYKVVGFDYGDEWQDHETAESTLVVIGRNLPFEELEQQFLSAQITC